MCISDSNINLSKDYNFPSKIGNSIVSDFILECVLELLFKVVNVSTPEDTTESNCCLPLDYKILDRFRNMRFQIFQIFRSAALKCALKSVFSTFSSIFF